MRLLILAFILFLDLFAQEILFREDFLDLNSWKHTNFHNIDKNSTYITKDGVLIASSDASASFIVYEKKFDIYKYPIVNFLWKIDSVLKKGDATKKEGDDYAIRIYILFEYNKEKANFAQKIQYGLFKTLYGEYPPHSSLNYIWANKIHKEKFMVNKFTDKAIMVVLEQGANKTNEWLKESINILQDYKEAFKTNPPQFAKIAIMSDSDNTKEKTLAYLDYIEVGSE